MGNTKKQYFNTEEQARSALAREFKQNKIFNCFTFALMAALGLLACFFMISNVYDGDAYEFLGLFVLLAGIFAIMFFFRKQLGVKQVEAEWTVPSEWWMGARSKGQTAALQVMTGRKYFWAGIGFAACYIAVGVLTIFFHFGSTDDLFLVDRGTKEIQPMPLFFYVDNDDYQAVQFSSEYRATGDSLGEPRLRAIEADNFAHSCSWQAVGISAAVTVNQAQFFAYLKQRPSVDEDYVNTKGVLTDFVKQFFEKESFSSQKLMFGQIDFAERFRRFAESQGLVLDSVKINVISIELRCSIKLI